MNQNIISDGKIRVALVHDVRLHREGLMMLLKQWPDFCIVELLPEGAGTQIPGIGPKVDLLLLDVSCGYAGVSDKIHRAKELSREAKIVVIGVPDCSSVILTCIESGAAAFTTQDCSPEQLVKTLRMVNLGQTVCPPTVSALLFQRVADLKRQVHSPDEDRLSRLTKRELQILWLVSDGMSNKEIAVQLQLELQTVKNYVHSILEKMQVSNRREAANYVGILPELNLVLTPTPELSRL